MKIVAFLGANDHHMNPASTGRFRALGLASDGGWPPVACTTTTKIRVQCTLVQGTASNSDRKTPPKWELEAEHDILDTE